METVASLWRRTVDAITDDGVPQCCEVYAKLVRASGLGVKGQAGSVPMSLQNLKVGAGGLAAYRIHDRSGGESAHSRKRISSCEA